MRFGGFLLLCTALCLSCTGEIEPPDNRPPGFDGPGDGPDDMPDVPLDCTELKPGRSPLRRLTVTEYDNTIRRLFGDTTNPAARLVDDERGVTSADARSVSTLLAEQYMSAAEEVAERAVTELDSLIACDRAAEGDDVCAREFIERKAGEAFRRPATEEQVDLYYTLFDVVRSEQNFREGIRAVVEALLQSPDFLYRVELAPAGTEAIVRLDGYQLATRLSYLIWNDMPTSELFDAAERGDLDTNEGVERLAREMLADGRAEPAVRNFFHHYLELEQLETLSKDTEVFPDWTDDVPALFEQETEAFVHEVMFNRSGSWEELLTAPWSMMNEELASYYGVPGVTGDEFVRVELDPTHHSGMLTQGSLMSTRARTYETNPIQRGMFVRAALLCGEVPDLPEGVMVDPPDPDPTLTTRERLAEHRDNEVCAACHIQMDPLGFAFEHFDADGRFRPDENGLPIDATGVIVATDVDGEFDGNGELVDRVLASEGAQECFGKAWFEFAYARALEDVDGCSMETMMERFRDNDFDVRELIVSLTQTDAFLHLVRDQDSITSTSGAEE